MWWSESKSESEVIFLPQKTIIEIILYMSITTHLSNKESKINETDRVKSYIYSIDQSNRNETKQI